MRGVCQSIPTMCFNRFTMAALFAATSIEVHASIVRTNAFGLGADAQINEQNGGNEARGDHWELAARYTPSAHNQHMLIRLDLSGITAADLTANPLTTFRTFVNRNGWNQGATTFQYFGLRPEASNQLWEESQVTFRTAPGLAFDGDLTTRGFTSDLSLIGEQLLSGPRPAGSPIEFTDTALGTYLRNVIGYYESHAGTPVATFVVAVKEGSPANQNFVVKSNDADSSAGTGLLSGSQFNPQIVLTSVPTGTVQSAWRGGTGLWSVANNWAPTVVPSNNGSTTFDVIFSASSSSDELQLDTDATVESYQQTGGVLAVVGGSSRRIVATKRLELSSAILRSITGGTLNLESRDQARLSGELRAQNVVIDNFGTMTYDGDAAYRETLIGRIHNHAGATFELHGTNAIDAGFVNEGTLRRMVSTGPSMITRRFQNTGAVTITSGLLAFEGDASDHGGTYDVASGTELRFSRSNQTVTGIVRGEGRAAFTHSTLVRYQGTLAITGAIETAFRGAVRFESGAVIVPSSATWSLGAGSVSFFTGAPVSLHTVQMHDGTVAGTDLVRIVSRLTGTGTVTTPLSINGTLAPGNSIGDIYIEGGCELKSGSVTEIELDSAGADRILVRGSFNLGGNLAIEVLNGFVPTPDATFTVIDSDIPLTGAFDNVAAGTRLLLPDGSSFRVDYGAGGTSGADKLVLSQFIIPEPSQLVVYAAFVSLLKSRARHRRALS